MKFVSNSVEILWEMDKMLERAFSPFPTMLSKKFFLEPLKQKIV